MTIGKQLKTLRESRKKSQQEVCSVLNIGQSTLANYENDKRMPKIEILIKIAEYYQVSVDYILGIEKSSYNNCETIIPNEFVDAFKLCIKDLMKEQKMSEDTFMKKTGFTKDKKNVYLYGNPQPTIDEIIKLSNIFNVSADYLLNISQKKRLSLEEEKLLKLFNCCDDECKNYLIAKAGVLCVGFIK